MKRNDLPMTFKFISIAVFAVFTGVMAVGMTTPRNALFLDMSQSNVPEHPARATAAMILPTS